MKLYGWLALLVYISETWIVFWGPFDSFLGPQKVVAWTQCLSLNSAVGTQRVLTLFSFSEVFLEIVSEKSRYSLHQNMDKIKVPTQIIWGKQDQVCSVSLGPPVPVALAFEEKQEVIYKVSLIS